MPDMQTADLRYNGTLPVPPRRARLLIYRCSRMLVRGW